jgi:hypothetical protein
VSRAQWPDAYFRRPGFAVFLILLPSAVSAQESLDYVECSSNERVAYIQTLRQKVLSNWRLPGRYGNVRCTLFISQTFRGEILHAAAEDCDDPILIKSLEDAAYLSSPLPTPENRDCFSRELRVRMLWQAG